MNLSPDWTLTLRSAGHDALHWSTVGRADAPDGEILDWAKSEARVILTSDLDFGAALAVSGASAPSVVQLRTATTLSSHLGSMVTRVSRDMEAELASGALVTVDGDRVRLRPLTFTAKS